MCTLGLAATTEGHPVGHRHHDLVTNPSNWTKTYPGSAHVGSDTNEGPLKVGDTWTETGPDGERIFTWHLAIAMRPQSGCSTRSAGWAMTVEAYRDSPMPDGFLRMVNPANIDKYRAAIARELSSAPVA